MRSRQCRLRESLVLRVRVGVRTSSVSSREMALAADDPNGKSELELLTFVSMLGHVFPCEDLESFARFVGGASKSMTCIGAEEPIVDGDRDAELRVVMLPMRLGGFGRSGEARGESTGIP